ncbi:MAG: hypothetical protein KGL39_18215 [Patescibacteria group bacterium]|nr:hypothetical protein [Patescibacteria group bacterium]
MSLADFLGHKTRETGSKSAFLNGSWKDEISRNEQGVKEAHLDVWLHTKSLFTAVWRHNWPQVFQKQDGTRNLYNSRMRCLESESTLRRQYFRSNGRREAPPTICPHCLLIENVRQLVESGQLDWKEVLFRFTVDGNTIELHAGGIYNGFKKANDEQKKELAAAGIYLKEAWKENCMAACSYVFPVVVAGKEEDGIMISVEKDSLGDAFKRTLANQIESRKAKGNPLLNPYPLRWKYYPDEENPNKRYDVLPLIDEEPSPEVLQLIVDTDPPEDQIAKVLDPPNMKSLRAAMEQYCTYDLNWDAIFGPVEKYCDENGNYHAPTENATAKPKPAAKPTLADTPAAKAKVEPETKPAPATTSGRRVAKPEVKMGPPCDKCGAAMREDQTECTGCGTKYELVADDNEATGEPPF